MVVGPQWFDVVNIVQKLLDRWIDQIDWIVEVEESGNRMWKWLLRGDVTNLLRSRHRIRFAVELLELRLPTHSGMELLFYIEINYIHFEITGDPWNLIGPKWCNLFPNCTIFCSKLHSFFSPSKWKWSNTNRILILTMILCDFKMDVIKW